MATQEQAPEFKAFFGTAKQLRMPQSEFSILITPSRDNWNDFGHRSRVAMKIRTSEGGPTLELSGFIGFLKGAPSGVSDLEEAVKSLGDISVPATTESHRFFTLLPDMEAYRRIVRALGPAMSRQALLAANDLVALREFRPTLRTSELAEKTEVFRMSFVRTSDAYFAYRNAGPILRGLQEEELGKLSSSLSIRFRLLGRSNDHDLQFSFDYDSVLPKRVAVVIGKNGVGKSQTLGRIADAAIRGKKGLTGPEKERLIISRLLVFAPASESDSVFPAEPKGKEPPRISYYRFSLSRSRRPSQMNSAAALIRDLYRTDRDIKGIPRWRFFYDALRSIADHEQLSLVASTEQGERCIPIRELRAGGEAERLSKLASINWRREPKRVVGGKALPLSSGELAFVKFAAQVSLHIENGSLLLLDEPETHLHPNFISRFSSLLNRLLRDTGSAAIVATHSVYFLREVFRDQVTVLRIDENGVVQAERPRIRTFGGDVGAISFFVFGEDGPSPLATELQSKLLSSTRSWEDIFNEYKDELSPEFLMALRRKIEGAA